MASTNDPVSNSAWFCRATSRRHFIGVIAAALGTAPTAMVLVASGAQITPSQPTGRRLRITLGHHHPPGGQVDVYAHDFADLVAKKTNGQAAVDVMPAAQLGAEQEAAKGVQLGSLQMTIVSGPLFDDYLKEMGTEQLPYLFDTWDQAIHVHLGPVGDEMAKRLLPVSNVRCLSWLLMGWRHMFFRSTNPTTLAGIKGLKIRSPQMDLYVKMFELLGAKPVMISMSEVYTALQSGVADGAENPFQSAIDNKWTEVCKHILLTRHMFNSLAHMVNKQFFASLPTNVQDAIVESAKEAAMVFATRSRAAEEAAVNNLKSAGITIVTPSDPAAWKSAVRPLIDIWIKARPGSASLIEMIRATK